ncbi:MAG: DinB family protein [Candidatus Zixiibacteriota bacterium]|nr:MAG: DinB family protein [candidate division Zixibacteria bacterium]
MFTSVKAFADQWKEQSDATRKILGALSEESLSVTVAPEHRDLARMAWHIVQTIPEMAELTGLKLEWPAKDTALPETLNGIREGYEAAAGSLLKQIQKNWTDDTLQVEDNMFGETWKRGYSLMVIVQHEIHHRGQMTVLMRQAGLKVPGVFGPSKEEWANYNAPPPEI